MGLFRGENFGKLLVRVGDDPTRTRGVTDMGHKDQLREHLLGGAHAHLNLDKVVAGLPPNSGARSLPACRTRPGGCWSTC